MTAQDAKEEWQKEGLGYWPKTQRSASWGLGDSCAESWSTLACWSSEPFLLHRHWALCLKKINHLSHPQSTVLSEGAGDMPKCCSNAFPFLEVYLLLCCPSSLPQVWCWSWSPLCHAIKKEWKEVRPQQERVSFPSVQVPFPSRLSSVLEGSPKVILGLRKSAESGIFFFGSDPCRQMAALLRHLSQVFLGVPPSSSPGRRHKLARMDKELERPFYFSPSWWAKVEHRVSSLECITSLLILVLTQFSSIEPFQNYSPSLALWPGLSFCLSHNLFLHFPLSFLLNPRGLIADGS